MGQRELLQQKMLEQEDVYILKRLNTDLTHFTKINSKQIRDLSVRCKTIKPLDDNTGEGPDNLWYGNVFLATTPKAWSMKEIIDKLEFVKIKNLCSVKNSFKKMRRNNIG